MSECNHFSINLMYSISVRHHNAMDRKKCGKLEGSDKKLKLNDKITGTDPGSKNEHVHECVFE